MPNLATALTTLGRAWHKEYNKPVWDAIDGLQQAVTSFSTSMLSAEFIHGQSMLRTIRASGNLEDAKVAWSRLLNMPGGEKSRTKRSVLLRPVPTGRFYSHEELWSRDNGKNLEVDEVPANAIATAEEVPVHRTARWFAA
ncbi:hypothetical protein DM02DRAFT_674864 [Periconia macrospinosa]|uniref:Uncharacterized protein n=1 Tax=Periconia macrospinosa TaxID=97972 RepID=A0A2V1DEB6_9PLEO|nr:hypothetical protein DM02DRAFT_674864 [Periconia macrospinosa]